MAISMRKQHQSAIEEAKASLDQTNPINRVITKVDDPTEDSEMLIYWLDTNNIPCMRQTIYLPVDVSKIEQMRVDEQIKQEAIDYKSEKASQKIVWISRKDFIQLTGLGDGLRKFIDKYSYRISSKEMKVIEGGSEVPPSWYMRKFSHIQCRTYTIPSNKLYIIDTYSKSMPLNLLSFNVNLNTQTEDIYFPSTFLPEIFRKYSKKSGICNKLEYFLTKDEETYNKNQKNIELRVKLKSYIYIIKSHDYDNVYKIGVAIDVDARLKDLQTSNPALLEVVYSYEYTTPYKVEKIIHNHYSDNCIRGEWFAIDDLDECKQFIESL